MSERSELLAIYFTEDEKERIEKVAEKQGLSKSSFGRQKLLKAAGEA